MAFNTKAARLTSVSQSGLTHTISEFSHFTSVHTRSIKPDRLHCPEVEEILATELGESKRILTSVSLLVWLERF